MKVLQAIPPQSWSWECPGTSLSLSGVWPGPWPAWSGSPPAWEGACTASPPLLAWPGHILHWKYLKLSELLTSRLRRPSGYFYKDSRSINVIGHFPWFWWKIIEKCRAGCWDWRVLFIWFSILTWRSVSCLAVREVREVFSRLTTLDPGPLLPLDNVKF